MSVPRETLESLVRRWSLLPAESTALQLGVLLAALAGVPNPPTTVSDPERAIDVHIADSLVGLEVAELRAAERIADLGSGAGFPGLPLAIASPDAHVDLVESVRRKVDVIEHLAAVAGVANARVLGVRAEELAAGEGREAYDAVTARALASLPVLVEYAAPLLRAGGVLVAWKGARDTAEEAAGRAAAAKLGMEEARVLAVHPYASSLNLNLHVYLKSNQTPTGFPRRPGVAAKRPLA